ncbi:hypothetical protein [Aeromicrobium sp. Root472D3]|uniref:hypothetical protein n=1 Tax=Aeromicrobium sp. Root472D3 TaxID=1736540 RepID=UPI0006FBE52C|nr:hypothetical protein [Aeromicrobium sp. Root472D3]KQX75878.1 hypothetical protein ASD10_12255 [Aeromicrobium sp. Root472D3]
MRSLLGLVTGSEDGDAAPRGPALPSRQSMAGVVPVDAVDERAREALGTALSMAPRRVVAVHVCRTPESARAFTRSWEEWEPGVPLVLLDPVRTDGDEVADSVADYVGRRHTAHQTLVVLTERPASSRSSRRPTSGAEALEAALLPLPHVVVCRHRTASSPAAPSPRPTVVPDLP